MALRMAARLATGIAARSLVRAPAAPPAGVLSAPRRLFSLPQQPASSFTLPAAARFASTSPAASAATKANKGPQFLMPVTIGVAVITTGLSVVFFGELSPWERERG